MDLTRYLPTNSDQTTLEDLLRWETSRVDANLDSLSANRQIERLQVAAAYVSAYLGDRARRSIQVSEVAGLDGYTVADRLEPDLDADGKAGIARTVANLVARIRMFDVAA